MTKFTAQIARRSAERAMSIRIEMASCPASRNDAALIAARLSLVVMQRQLRSIQF